MPLDMTPATVGDSMMPREEFETRHARLCLMIERRNDIDCVLATRSENMLWATGLTTWDGYHEHAMLVVPGREQPVLFVRDMDRGTAVRKTWLAGDNVVSLSESLIDRGHTHLFEDVARWLRDNGYGAMRIGFEDANISAKGYFTLKHGLPDAQFVPVGRAIDWLRFVKSPREIALMRDAGEIADAMAQFFTQNALPGTRKSDLLANLQAMQIRGVGDIPGCPCAMPTFMQMDGDTTSPHVISSTHDRIGAKSTIVAEFAGVAGFYHVPVTRTVITGTPHPLIAKLRPIAEEGIERVLESLKPGVEIGEVARAHDEFRVSHGLKPRTARMGYGIGLGIDNRDWGENTISVRPDDRTVLEPGMTMHIMPGIWGEDIGISLTQSVVITDSGCEALTRHPRRLVLHG